MPAGIFKKQFYTWAHANQYSLMRKPRSQQEHQKYFNSYVKSQLGGQKLLPIFKPFTSKYGWNPDEGGPSTKQARDERRRQRQLKSEREARRQVMPRDGRKASLLGRSSLIERRSFT